MSFSVAPTSSLHPLIAKLFERILALSSFSPPTYSLMPLCSGFCLHHTPERTLTKVTNDHCGNQGFSRKEMRHSRWNNLDRMS